jgi:tetrahydromethanopterin S-methyltransferase subunit A
MEIAGMVNTANLGTTRIIVNITTNPAIRFLLMCCKDSALFKPGQSLLALSENGVDNEPRTIGAEGYDPVLSTIEQDQVAQFRRQIHVLDWMGEENIQTLEQNIKSLVTRSPGSLDLGKQSAIVRPVGERFDIIRPGGQREPLLYDPKGYFVITIEPTREEIVLRHYTADHTPAHEMRG